MQLRFAAVLASCGAVFSCSNSGDAPSARPSSEVDPLTGTGGLGFTVGSIPPGPQLPFGFARPGPDTATRGGAPDFSHCAGYWYEDTELRGFTQLHAAGTGIPDYGVVMIMPVLDLAPNDSDYSAQLDHRREHASVGWYSVDLVPSAIKVELTATLRTSLYRITYPAAGAASLVVDLMHGLGGETREFTIEADPTAREVTGSMLHAGALAAPSTYRVFFVMRFDSDFTSRAEHRDGTAVLDFATGSTVRVQIGLSFVDLAGARANLDAEWAGFDLEKTRDAAIAAWDSALSRIEIEGGTPEYRKRFYTALYHAQLMPTLFTDIGGAYRGLDEMEHQADGFTYFTDFSLWDTFRTMHPLMTLVYPERQTDFVRSMLAMTEQSGRVPKWPLATVETDTMIGYHGETVIIDSWLNGIRSFDAEAFYSTFLRRAAMGEDPTGRRRDCFDGYATHGYCPADQEGGSASKTLENAFADFALSRFAEDLGHTDDATMLRTRAEAWSLILNENGRVQGRNADGSFAADFRDDLFSDEFVEGNSRQWTVFVPHDIPKLAEKMGGDHLVEFLSSFFDNAESAEKTIFPDLWYWHGNEPDIHAAYMFAELGRRDLTERWVRWIIDHRYANSPAGLDGNDDGGTLSSWYVFSALGFFPKVAEARYVLGAPLFPKATIHLAGGKTFTVRAENWSERAIHVRSVKLDGVPIEGPFVTFAEIQDGGELVFEMTE